MNFGQALESLKLGSKVSREGWNGKGLWVELQRPDNNSKMTERERKPLPLGMG
jgi:hypothetical protein